MTEIERVICEILNQFCFDNIWNEPFAEYRANIKPIMLSTRSKIGSIIVAGEPIALPTTTTPYYIYGIGVNKYSGIFKIFFDTKEWISTEELCNKYNIVLNVYHLQGKMLNKGKIYVRYDHTETVLLMAVEKIMLDSIIGYKATNEVYTTMYYDSDWTDKITIKSVHIPEVDKNNLTKFTLQEYIDSLADLNKMIVYINGYAVELTDMGDINNLDYIDIVYDENIKFKFEIDLTKYGNDNTFFSKMDSTNKQIIHIPKELNLENRVYTHNTIDFFIRQKYTDSYSEKGLYMHRLADRGVTQITHNDFGIPMYIVDDYRDYLETQEIKINVVVRQHSKDNILIRDKSYIDLLYTHSDEKIIEFLKGNEHYPELFFWRADELEKTKYIEMLFNVPDVIRAENMYDYVEGLGYYHVVSLLCNRIVSTTITDTNKRTFSVTKPYIYQNYPIIPIIYKNGEYVSPKNFTYSNSSDEFIVIQFKEDYLLKIDDVITIVMFVDNNKSIYSFTPSMGNNVLEIPYTDFVIYKKINNGIILTHGIDKSSNTSYEKITKYLGNISVTTTNNGSKIVFSSTTFGNEYIIQNTKCVFTYSYSLNEQITNGTALHVNLENPIFNIEGATAPILDITNTAVYLNNKYLIEGLDYHIVDVLDQNNFLSFKQLIIQNRQYLNTTDNNVDIYLHQAVKEDNGYDFLIEHRTNYNETPNVWFPNMSTLHADGKLAIDPLDMGSYLLVKETEFREGAPYEIQTNIPSIVHDFIQKYHVNDDKERIIILNKYFYDVDKTYPSIVFIPYSHRLYSTYIATIIRDIVKQTLTVVYDPDENRMKNQVASYDYLKKFDLVDENINFKFVDVFPTYRQYILSNVELYRVIHALIRILSIDDKIHSGEVIHG